MKTFNDKNNLIPGAYQVWAFGKLSLLASIWCIVNNRGPAAPVEPKDRKLTLKKSCLNFTNNYVRWKQHISFDVYREIALIEWNCIKWHKNYINSHLKCTSVETSSTNSDCHSEVQAGIFKCDDMQFQKWDNVIKPFRLALHYKP